MERKGGCLLVPRYGTGAGVGGQAPPGVSWQMGRIMLKFRPIAPKPAAMAPAPTPAPVTAAAGRGKRKAVAGGRRGRKPKKAATVAPAAVAPVVAAPAVGEKEKEKEKSVSSRSSSSSAMTSVDSSPPSPPPPPPAPQQHPPATLPLMPVSPTQEETKAEAPAAPVVEPPARAAGAQPAAASCWVTVEDVTSTWRDGEAPSSAASACDESAPAFVSDRWGRVTWSNAAFTRAAVSDDEATTVALAGALPAWGTCAGFTCRVRVRHSSSGPLRRRGGGGSVVAPCDVWRLDADGCYLWRLDLQAALTLGGGLP